MKNVIGHFIAAFGFTSRFPGDAKSNCYKKKMFIGKKKTHTVMMCSLIHCKKKSKKTQSRYVPGSLVDRVAALFQCLLPAQNGPCTAYRSPHLEQHSWTNCKHKCISDSHQISTHTEKTRIPVPFKLNGI